MWQRSKRRGNRFLDRETLGSTLGLASALMFLVTLALASCGLTQVSGEAKGRVMALFTPSLDTFAPHSESPSNRMPLPWFYHISRVRDLGILPQARLGDL